jgi:hypothetical protein
LKKKLQGGIGFPISRFFTFSAKIFQNESDRMAERVPKNAEQRVISDEQTIIQT